MGSLLVEHLGAFTRRKLPRSPRQTALDPQPAGAASIGSHGAAGRPPFKKRPTVRGEILSTMPCSAASSAKAEGVQWLIRRPTSSGSRQARANTWATSSAEKVGGAPLRGRSPSTASISAPSFSGGISARRGCALAKRERQVMTVSRVMPSSVAMAVLEAQASALSTIEARRTSCWEAKLLGSGLPTLNALDHFSLRGRQLDKNRVRAGHSRSPWSK